MTGEPEPGSHVDLCEERLDALVNGHGAVPPAEQVDVAADRRRLEPEPVAETAEAEDVLLRQARIVAPGLVADHFEPGARRDLCDALQQAFERVPARKPLVR